MNKVKEKYQTESSCSTCKNYSIAICEGMEVGGLCDISDSKYYEEGIKTKEDIKDCKDYKRR